MNELLQKHGCSNVFTVPEGLRELMADISREVLRQQPSDICEFIANYLSALLITREHGVMAVKILDDLCDCRPSVSEHLIHSGMPSEQARTLSYIIKEEIERMPVVDGKEKLKEAEILKKILKRQPLDEETTAKVCHVARNAYRDYWYRKKMLEQNLKVQPTEPWELAAQHTLEVYKKTKPSFSELTRATQKIQAAYRGYHVRRNMLAHLMPKKKHTPKVDLHGPVNDIAESRHIDLGPVVDINDKVKKDDMSTRFVTQEHFEVGLCYDTMRTITHEPPEKPKEIIGDNSKDNEMMAKIIADNKELRIMTQKSLKTMQSELYGPSQAFLMTALESQMFGPSQASIKKSSARFSKSDQSQVASKKSLGVISEPIVPTEKRIFVGEPIPSPFIVKKPVDVEPSPSPSSVKKSAEESAEPSQTPTYAKKKSIAGFIEPSETGERKSIGGLADPNKRPSIVKKTVSVFVEPDQSTQSVKKSIKGFIEPGDTETVASEKESVGRFIASAPHSEVTVSEGPVLSQIQQEDIRGDDMASEIPEDIQISEGPSPTFDFELTSADTASTKTESVPTSASTTAPTSDVDDVPSEGE